MTRKILIAALAFVILTVLSIVPVFAQSNGPCSAYATGIPYNNLPGYFACYLIEFVGYTCLVHTHCPPHAGKEETKNGHTCPSCLGSKPISLTTGNTYIEQTDVRIPGLSGGLALSRIWNSMWPSTQMSSQTGLFGMNWRSTYEERIFVGSDTYVKYARSDGSFWSFGGAGTFYVVAPANATATLTTDNAQTQWILTFQNGEKRIFSYISGSLISIIDRNGNATQVSYDGLNRLVTIADPGGRHLYFGYANDSSYLVTSVTSDVGISLSYAYDSHARLLQVTEPDQTTLSFEYGNVSPDYLITAVKDSDGKVLESHTYDLCGRGVTGSQAGGVGAVALSYPSLPCPSLFPTWVSEY